MKLPRGRGSMVSAFKSMLSQHYKRLQNTIQQTFLRMPNVCYTCLVCNNNAHRHLIGIPDMNKATPLASFSCFCLYVFLCNLCLEKTDIVMSRQSVWFLHDYFTYPNVFLPQHCLNHFHIIFHFVVTVLNEPSFIPT